MISKGSSCPGLQRNQDVNSFREESSIDLLSAVRICAPWKILGEIDYLFDMVLVLVCLLIMHVLCIYRLCVCVCFS